MPQEFASSAFAASAHAEDCKDAAPFVQMRRAAQPGHRPHGEGEAPTPTRPQQRTPDPKAVHTSRASRPTGSHGRRSKANAEVGVSQQREHSARPGPCGRRHHASILHARKPRPGPRPGGQEANGPNAKTTRTGTRTLVRLFGARNTRPDKNGARDKAALAPGPPANKLAPATPALQNPASAAQGALVYLRPGSRHHAMAPTRATKTSMAGWRPRLPRVAVPATSSLTNCPVGATPPMQRQ